MTSQDDLAKLEQLIERHEGLDLAKASRAIGHDNAYLQQFIRYGKPRYLKEEDRAALELLLERDLSFLKPPPKKPQSSKQAATVSPDEPGRFVNQPEQLALLDFWDSIKSEDDRLRLFRMITAYAEPIPAKRR